MNKINNKPCIKCGGNTRLTYVLSTGMDILPTGLKRTCLNCGFEEFIKSLDSKDDIEDDIDLAKIRKMKGLPANGGE